MARLGIGVAAAAAAVVAAALVVSCLRASPAEAYSGGSLGYSQLLTTAHLGAISSSSCGGRLGRQCSAAVGADGGLLRRALAARKPTNRYVSYSALDANKVPCNKRGQTYYQNCASQQAANPYRRGCSAITRCSRNMN
ncbi:protein RALF-like 33 [Oryza glaberrima]|uniref:protein RALF-like 33 n=1 Tax=Oryza glaberrima TaxID=4538 RepID=UPI00224C4F7B|nr:protein RALF-like 33 [Oryza glaberrima]